MKITDNVHCYIADVVPATTRPFKTVTPSLPPPPPPLYQFFYLSDITNSSSYSGKSPRKKSMLEFFCANVIEYNLRDKLVISEIIDISTSEFMENTPLQPGGCGFV